MREYVNHYGAVRVRATGTGFLRFTLYSQDEVYSKELAPVIMKTADPLQPNRLCNLVSQRATLKIYTNGIDDYFQINRILVFTKTIYSGYPNNG